MKIFIPIFFTLVSSWIFAGSQTVNISHEIALSPNAKVVLLDSTDASLAIITDETDHFFKRATMTEMEIQMKRILPCSDYEACMTEYKSFLSNDVEDFSEEEAQKTLAVFKNIGEMIKKVNPKLLDTDIQLIKTKGTHYGNSVYYTRENKIIIPKNELENFNEDAFTQVMLHEFFHVLSRTHPELRNEIYALIGFQEVQGEIVLPERLEKTKLLNPDGTTDYMIPLTTDDGREVLAYPLINASELHYKKDKPEFFNYLNFSLYEIVQMENLNYQLLIDESGVSTIPFQKIPSFFTKIKDNTSYIIHPDEITADNFVFTVFYLAEDKKLKNFSQDGMKLIEHFGEILQKYE